MKNLNKHTLSGSLYPSQAPRPTASPRSLPSSFILFGFSQRVPLSADVLITGQFIHCLLHRSWDHDFITRLIARCFSWLKLQHLGPMKESDNQYQSTIYTEAMRFVTTLEVLINMFILPMQTIKTIMDEAATNSSVWRLWPQGKQSLKATEHKCELL